MLGVIVTCKTWSSKSVSWRVFCSIPGFLESLDCAFNIEFPCLESQVQKVL